MPHTFSNAPSAPFPPQLAGNAKAVAASLRRKRAQSASRLHVLPQHANADDVAQAEAEIEVLHADDPAL